MEDPFGARQFSIPEAGAVWALKEFVSQSTRQLIYSGDAVRGVRTNAVHGRFTPIEALELLLHGTDLTAVEDAKTGALLIRGKGVEQISSRTQTPSKIPEESQPAMKKNILVALLGGILSLGNAQTSETTAGSDAVLRGRVSNEATGDNLGGATVRVEGTGRVAYTDRDGTYVIRNLPPGPATIRVAYPGLDAATSIVNITAGLTTRQDFALTSDIYVMPEFAVSGTREGNALAIARQEQSSTVMNTVSSDAFGSVAQNNIANVLRRLPGVVGEVHGTNVGSISVRGMDEQHTVVSIDGTAGAGASIETDGVGQGTGSLGRASLPLGSVPAEFIDSVEVIKTPTADMDADSLGGVVNLRTKNSFDAPGRTMNLTAGVNYNMTRGKKVHPFKSEYLFPSFQMVYGDVYSVLGGDRNLGMLVTANHSVAGETTGVARAFAHANWDFESPTLPERVAFPDSFQMWRTDTNSLNTRFDYKLAEDSSISFSGGYTKYRRFKDDMRPRLDAGSVVPGEGPNHDESSDELWVFDNAGIVILRQPHIRKTQTWRWNMQGDHQNDSVRVTWDLTFSPSSEVWNRNALQNIDTLDNISYIWDRSSFMHPKFVQTGGRDIHTNNMDNVSRVRARYEHFLSSHDVYGGRFDIEKRFDGAMPFKLKGGMRVRQEYRDVTQNRMDSSTNVVPAMGPDFSAYVDHRWTYNFHGGLPNVPMPDPWRFYADAGIRYAPEGNPDFPGVPFVFNPGFFTFNVNNTIRDSNRDNWASRDTIKAVFMQGEVNLTDQLRMTAGMRYEMTDVSVTKPFDNVRAPTVLERWTTLRTLNSDYDNWFPNLQFRYEPWERVIVRAAYSTTIGRPKISDISGRMSIDELNEIISFSNVGLEPQEGKNLDLSVEYYFEPVGVVSVSLFRKRINNFIASVTLPAITGNEFGLDLSEYIGWEGRTKENVGKGTVDGIELNYSQQFSFLPGIWRGFGVYANWTALSSKGDFGELNPPPDVPIKNVLPKFRPETGNFGLSYTYARWDLRLMWNYTSAYLEDPNFSDLGRNWWRGKREQIDFYGTYQATPKIQIFGEILNIGPKLDSAFHGLPTGPRQIDTVWMPMMLTAGVKARF